MDCPTYIRVKPPHPAPMKQDRRRKEYQQKGYADKYDRPVEEHGTRLPLLEVEPQYQTKQKEAKARHLSRKSVCPSRKILGRGCG